jgi:acyl-[acyl-carrier-protein]-phospholipid O-acyltransferase/long-chain-fatty-acid--[acyl-carrier-protein] ligase
MQKQAKTNPKKVIIEDLTTSLTYGKLLLSVNVLSKKLKEELKDETRIGIYLPNVVGQAVVLFSLFKNEQEPCLLNFSMGTSSLIDCIETASLKTVLTSRKFIEMAELGSVVEEMEKRVQVIYLEDLKANITLTQKLRGMVETKLPSFTSRKQTNVILFTSGSENKPKGVILTHRNLYANVKQVLATIEILDTDRIFNPLPMFHSFGLTAGTLLPIIANVKTFLYPSPLHYKEIPKFIHKDKSTIMFGTNTFFDYYEKYATEEQLKTLRYVVAGAERLRSDVKEKYKNKFNITLLEGYGATETSPVISLNTPDNLKEGSTGKLLPMMEAQIKKVEGIEEGGSLLVKGPNVMSGYLIHGRGFIPSDEWYDTGDIVKIDEEGYIFILSRLKRFSKIAGEMVSLNKVEELAFQCFGDSSFFTVAIPDKRKGEKIILFTTKEDIQEKEFKKYIKQHKVSSLYIPAKIVYIEKVPLLGSGKINYIELEVIAKELKTGLF